MAPSLLTRICCWIMEMVQLLQEGITALCLMDGTPRYNPQPVNDHLLRPMLIPNHPGSMTLGYSYPMTPNPRKSDACPGKLSVSFHRQDGNHSPFLTLLQHLLLISRGLPLRRTQQLCDLPLLSPQHPKYGLPAAQPPSRIHQGVTEAIHISHSMGLEVLALWGGTFAVLALLKMA